MSEENSFVLYKWVLCEVQAIAKTYPQTRAVSCQGNKVTKIAKVLLCNDVNVPGNFVVSITSHFLELCCFFQVTFSLLWHLTCTSKTNDRLKNRNLWPANLLTFKFQSFWKILRSSRWFSWQITVPHTRNNSSHTLTDQSLESQLLNVRYSIITRFTDQWQNILHAQFELAVFCFIFHLSC